MSIWDEPARKAEDFHAHIYYVAETRAIALRVREALKVRFSHSASISQMVDRPIGPHPVPMFEVDFGRGDFTAIVEWLMLNREALSVLVHPMTGNDLRDHRDFPLWLGAQVALDYAKL